jgi:hypothetical protein
MEKKPTPEQIAALWFIVALIETSKYLKQRKED